MEKKNFKKRNNKGYGRKSTSEQTAKYVIPTGISMGGYVEYKMSGEFIDDLLKNRKGMDAKKDAQEFLCDYVNEQCGLLGACVRVISM